jgi:tetratricopeptide (TPR) repeat protein
MLVGLGVALYARGLYDQALHSLFEASDLNPSDSTPYLFLGKIQGVETVESKGFVQKFARFASLQPDNALANYYYAVSLWKQSKGPEQKCNPKEVEDLLDKSIRLVPNLSVAYLQLGIIAAEQGDLQKAIRSYQKAVETDPSSPEAHYRLAQAYRRTGDKEKFQGEFQLYNELSKKSADQAERERQEIQQFVITLSDRGPTSDDR